MKHISFNYYEHKLFYLSLLITFVICLSVYSAIAQDNHNCKTVPAEIDQSHFTKAAKSEFIYIGKPGQKTLLSKLIKNNCIPESTSEKPVYIVFAGDFILDTNYKFCQGSELIAKKSAQIIIGADIEFYKSYLHACEKYWKGINIHTENFAFSMDKKTKVEDAGMTIGIGSKRKKINNQK